MVECVQVFLARVPIMGLAIHEYIMLPIAPAASVHADLTSKSSMEEVASKVADHVDVLVNNAGQRACKWNGAW